MNWGGGFERGLKNLDILGFLFSFFLFLKTILKSFISNLYFRLFNTRIFLSPFFLYLYFHLICFLGVPSLRTGFFILTLMYFRFCDVK